MYRFARGRLGSYICHPCKSAGALERGLGANLGRSYLLNGLLVWHRISSGCVFPPCSLSIYFVVNQAGAFVLCLGKLEAFRLKEFVWIRECLYLIRTCTEKGGMKGRGACCVRCWRTSTSVRSFHRTSLGKVRSKASKSSLHVATDSVAPMYKSIIYPARSDGS